MNNLLCCLVNAKWKCKICNKFYCNDHLKSIYKDISPINGTVVKAYQCECGSTNFDSI